MKNIHKPVSMLGFTSFLLGALLFFPFISSAAPLYRQLQLGMSGSDVSDLQAFLAKDSSVYPQGLVTGYFGTLTQSAVSKFQSKNGLAVVGRVGPLTMSLINSQMSSGGGSASIIGPVSVNATSTGTTIMWNTSQNTSATLYYGTTPLPMTEASPGGVAIVGGSSLLVNSDFTSFHTANLTGLQPNMTYYYVIDVRDSSGNQHLTWPATFRTTQ